MSNKIINIIIMVFVIGISILGGYFLNDTSECYTGETTITDIVFLEVLNELMDNHYSQPTKEQLLEGAVNGMIDALEDPHTTYFDYEEYSQYQSNFGETYVGIGVTVSFIDELVVVEEVKNGGPADNAGIRPNDIIAYVDGTDIRNEQYYEIISSIIGEEGTDVTIGVIRQGVEGAIYLTMTRAVIDNSSVNFETFISEGKTIGYIEVTTFGDETFGKFLDAIEDLEEIGIDGLIIDLRNNGGGRLNTVYNMMNQFLINNGVEMFSTEYYIDGEFYVQEYHATNTSLKNYNIVTLVNGNSASASEVFSSGMQEQGNYTVIGTTTFGKGTMQTDTPITATLSDMIHISIGKWVTSDGNWVHFNGGTDGVTPDVIVEQTDYEKAYKLFLFDAETLIFDQVDDRIANLQLILNIMGYEVREDGYFDQETKDAIVDIQTNNSLTANGNVDSQVLDIINAALDAFQDDPTNDTQLQAAINYLVDNPLND